MSLRDRYFRVVQCWRLICLVIGLAVFQIAAPAVALAQSDQNTAPKTHNVTVPYLLVILCLSLGFIMLCRSAGRTKEVKLDDLNDD